MSKVTYIKKKKILTKETCKETHKTIQWHSIMLAQYYAILCTELKETCKETLKTIQCTVASAASVCAAVHYTTCQKRPISKRNSTKETYKETCKEIKRQKRRIKRQKRRVKRQKRRIKRPVRRYNNENTLHQCQQYLCLHCSAPHNMSKETYVRKKPDKRDLLRDIPKILHCAIASNNSVCLRCATQYVKRDLYPQETLQKRRVQKRLVKRRTKETTLRHCEQQLCLFAVCRV